MAGTRCRRNPGRGSRERLAGAKASSGVVQSPGRNGGKRGTGYSIPGTVAAAVIVALGSLLPEALLAKPSQTAILMGTLAALLRDRNADGLQEVLVSGRLGERDAYAVLCGRTLEVLEKGHLSDGATAGTTGRWLAVDIDGDGVEELLRDVVTFKNETEREKHLQAERLGGKAVIWKTSLAEPGLRFSRAIDHLSAIPDVDGDGRPEVLVGGPVPTSQPLFDVSGPSGVVTLISGSSGKVLWSVSGAPNDHGFASSVAWVPAYGDNRSRAVAVGVPIPFGEAMDALPGRVKVLDAKSGRRIGEIGDGDVVDAFGAFLGLLRTPGQPGKDVLVTAKVGKHEKEGRMFVVGVELPEGKVTFRTRLDESAKQTIALIPSREGPDRLILLEGVRTDDDRGMKALRRTSVDSGGRLAPLATLSRPKGGSDSFGLNLLLLPDVDGDGVEDCLVGDWTYSTRAHGHCGAVFLFSGKTGTLLKTVTGDSVFLGTKK